MTNSSSANPLQCSNLFKQDFDDLGSFVIPVRGQEVTRKSKLPFSVSKDSKVFLLGGQYNGVVYRVEPLNQPAYIMKVFKTAAYAERYSIYMKYLRRIVREDSKLQEHRLAVQRVLERTGRTLKLENVEGETLQNIFIHYERTPQWDTFFGHFSELFYVNIDLLKTKFAELFPEEYEIHDYDGITDGSWHYMINEENVILTKQGQIVIIDID